MYYLRNIIYLFFLSTSLFANNIKIPQAETTTSNAKDVAKHGWKLAKSPLTKFITNDGNILIKKFLQEMKNPLKHSKVKNDIPKVLLTREHYYYALSYLKYLEEQKQTTKSLEIYFTIFKGLHKLNVNNFGMLAAVYKASIEKIATSSLNNSLKNNIYSKSQKRKIHINLKKYLLLDEKLFYKALQSERKRTIDLCEGQYGLENKIFNSFSLIELRSSNKKKLAKRICSRLSKELKDYNKKLGNIKNETAKNNLEKYMKKSEVNFYNNLNSYKKRSFEELKKLGEDPNNFINSIAGVLFYVSYTKKGCIQLKIRERVKENKKLLLSFGLFLPPNKHEELDNLP